MSSTFKADDSDAVAEVSEVEEALDVASDLEIVGSGAIGAASSLVIPFIHVVSALPTTIGVTSVTAPTTHARTPSNLLKADESSACHRSFKLRVSRKTKRPETIVSGLFYFKVLQGLVLVFVNQGVAFNPRHHTAKFFTNFFDLMAVMHTACRFKTSRT